MYNITQDGAFAGYADSYVYNGETKVWTGEAGAVADWSSHDFVRV